MEAVENGFSVNEQFHDINYLNINEFDNIFNYNIEYNRFRRKYPNFEIERKEINEFGAELIKNKFKYLRLFDKMRFKEVRNFQVLLSWLIRDFNFDNPYLNPVFYHKDFERGLKIRVSHKNEFQYDLLTINKYRYKHEAKYYIINTLIYIFNSTFIAKENTGKYYTMVCRILEKLLKLISDKYLLTTIEGRSGESYINEIEKIKAGFKKDKNQNILPYEVRLMKIFIKAFFINNLSKIEPELIEEDKKQIIEILKPSKPYGKYMKLNTEISQILQLILLSEGKPIKEINKFVILPIDFIKNSLYIPEEIKPFLNYYDAIKFIRNSQTLGHLKIMKDNKIIPITEELNQILNIDKFKEMKKQLNDFLKNLQYIILNAKLIAIDNYKFINNLINFIEKQKEIRMKYKQRIIKFDALFDNFTRLNHYEKRFEGHNLEYIAKLLKEYLMGILNGVNNSKTSLFNNEMIKSSDYEEFKEIKNTSLNNVIIYKHYIEIIKKYLKEVFNEMPF